MITCISVALGCAGFAVPPPRAGVREAVTAAVEQVLADPATGTTDVSGAICAAMSRRDLLALASVPTPPLGLMAIHGNGEESFAFTRTSNGATRKLVVTFTEADECRAEVGPG